MTKTPHPLRATLLASTLFAALGACRAPEPIEYPNAPVSDQVDEYHGVLVPDPYRWLEDSSSQETQRWIEEQNRLSRTFLDRIEERPAIRERLTELWDYERYGLPNRRGGRTFYTRNDGLQDQAVLYVVDGQGAQPRVLLDPNTLSTDNTIALADFVASHNGRYFAYGLSDGGSDRRTWFVLDLASGRLLEDVVTGNKFGGVEWDAEAKGFFYLRFDSEEEGEALVARNSRPDICYHALGTPESDDTVVVARLEDDAIFQEFTLTESRTRMVVVRNDIEARTTELHLFDPGSSTEPTPFLTGFDARYEYVGDDGKTMWVLTDLEAPRGRVIGIDFDSPARENWREVVPTSEDTIESVSAVGGRLIVRTMRSAASRVLVYTTDGALEREVELPGLGTARGFEGTSRDFDTYYSFESFTQPPTIYRLDLATGASDTFRRPTVDFDPTPYETYQVTYRSKDGHTMVPMFLTHRKGIEMDSRNPTYLYGYGGFNVSLTPRFDPSYVVWLELGGIVAVPSLRGGGEFGEEWHDAGTKQKKQNVFDDFSHAARWLIRNEYTTPRKIAIAGGSNGGLLVGACMTQEPGLYGAALPSVGVLDMLRFHTFTIGWAWVGEYGSIEDPNEFATLYAYSPVHNVGDGDRFPATLITTADHDDRVVPAHSYKFAAALQAAQGGSQPILLRVETRAGHGAGKPTSMRIDEAADKLAFLWETLDFETSYRQYY